MSNFAQQQQKTEAAELRVSIIEQALLAHEIPNTISAGSGAIAQPTPGQVEQNFITFGAAGAYTLANPVAGKPLPGGGGGQDGANVEITSTTAFAHTITTGTNGVNGSKHVITFPATAGTTIVLKAYAGSWWVQVVNGVVIT